MNKFAEALPYMYEYHKGVKVNISREDYYAYAFTLYKNEKFIDAITNFQRVTGQKDELHSMHIITWQLAIFNLIRKSLLQALFIQPGNYHLIQM